MSRFFILKASEAHTVDDFRLKDLPASSGRLDVVCRCAIASLLGEQGIRTDTTFISVLEGTPNPPLSLRFEGSELEAMPFSEIAVAAMLKRVLGETRGDNTERAIPHWSGVYIERKSFTEVLHSAINVGRLYYLHEKGESIRKVNLDIERNNFFVLGDHKGLDTEDEKTLDSLNATRITVGPISYLSSQVITLVHDEVDKRTSSI